MTLDEINDLIQSAREGDARALETLLTEFHSFLLALAKADSNAGLAVRCEPSDVVQETCFEIYRDFPNFRGSTRQEFKSWIRQILQNNLKNAIQRHVVARKRSIKKEQPLGDATAQVIGLGHYHKLAPDSQFSSPEQALVKSEANSELLMAIRQLPGDQCEAIRLRHLEGMTLKELAIHFDRSEDAVAGLLKRGLANLRSTLPTDHDR